MTDPTPAVNQAAGRYASALFELAGQAGELDRVSAELSGFAALLKESADLRRLVQSPLYGAEAKARGLAAVAEKAGFSPLVRKFLGAAAANRRAGDLADIIGAFQAMLARSKGHTRAHAASAAPLTDSEIARLKASLRAALGRDAELELSVDPTLLAGLRVRVGSRLFDSSLRSKLRGLRSAMKGA